ncbi:MAG: hypothetical protein LBP30_08220 [Clostridiales Family XIII bacterium]|jgi:hypothetical protein|nr:hypothetical protein [Clostridiales Family XIII bacterium]
MAQERPEEILPEFGMMDAIADDYRICAGFEQQQYWDFCIRYWQLTLAIPAFSGIIKA